jgi:glycosyltransferase involved in cell wall biosynthesis
MGEDTDCPASRFGRLFQSLILRGLRRADFVVCDSAATRNDLLQLADGTMPARSGVVLLAQNHPYRRLAESEVAARLADLPGFDPAIPFLLSVGLNLRRKNRSGILRIFSQMRSQWPGRVVFAGEPLDGETLDLAQGLGVADQVIQIQKPSNAVLEALYNRAFALIYPSKCEGFGWPIIEAQACGCPVVCSDRTSVPEVAGKGALVCPLEDEKAFADALLKLENPKIREQLIARGYENLDRFRTETMVDRYRDSYLRMVARPGSTLMGS